MYMYITCTILIISFIKRCIICELYSRRTIISVTLLCPINNLLSAFRIFEIVVDDEIVDESINEMKSIHPFSNQRFKI